MISIIKFISASFKWSKNCFGQSVMACFIRLSFSSVFIPLHQYTFHNYVTRYCGLSQVFIMSSEFCTRLRNERMHGHSKITNSTLKEKVLNYSTG